MSFGKYIREKRTALFEAGSQGYSLRRLAARIGVEPSYLSKIERDIAAPPSEAAIRRLAEALREDPDLLLALAGKVSADLRQIIQRRPRLFAELIRQLKDAPDAAVLNMVREARDFQYDAR